MLHPIWNPFSRFADRFEKKVDRFLHRQKIGNTSATQRDLLNLIQKNLVILNLWLEYKFKGYKYLTRHRRKVFYRNAEKIVLRFQQFCVKTQINEDALRTSIIHAGYRSDVAALLPANLEKLKYVAQIMLFLAPGKNYEYLEGASFGKLLTDLESQKMHGDCNQIVTFYTFLYSLKYNVSDLQIFLPPNHICLHFYGVDIEATNGTFHRYPEAKEVLPITELIATNLLDVSDFRDKQLQIDSREFLKGSRLAYNISSHRELVRKNLQVSYHNVGVSEMKVGNYDNAALYFELAGELDAVRASYHAAAVAEVDGKRFGRAHFYAAKTHDRRLDNFVTEREAFYYYRINNFAHARELFQTIGNLEMVKACYAGEYGVIQARVRGITDISTMKSHKYDYQQMLDLAYKLEDHDLIRNLQEVLKQL